MAKPSEWTRSTEAGDPTERASRFVAIDESPVGRDFRLELERAVAGA